MAWAAVQQGACDLHYVLDKEFSKRADGEIE